MTSFWSPSLGFAAAMSPTSSIIAALFGSSPLSFYRTRCPPVPLFSPTAKAAAAAAALEKVEIENVIHRKLRTSIGRYPGEEEERSCC
ncbi:unnamed protein product [Victoria cruziana]